MHVYSTQQAAHVVNMSFQKKRHRPKRNFIDGQPLINKIMRAILVDWLVEVAEEYSLVPETLFLTVNYIDRFLSSNVIVDPSKLQLVGVACMLIASKLEEIYPPEISEFVYITNSTYTGDEVRHNKVNTNSESQISIERQESDKRKPVSVHLGEIKGGIKRWENIRHGFDRVEQRLESN